MTAIGDTNAVLSHLRQGYALRGCLYNDYEIFERAWHISQEHPRTTVWQLDTDIPDSEFDRIKALVEEWYGQQQEFLYAFPNDDAETDTCATFPRRLGILLPEESGYLVYYVRVLQENGRRWSPVSKGR